MLLHNLQHFNSLSSHEHHICFNFTATRNTGQEPNCLELTKLLNGNPIFTVLDTTAGRLYNLLSPPGYRHFHYHRTRPGPYSYYLVPPELLEFIFCEMNTLSEERLQDIAYSLDRLKENKVEYWRLLIPLLPKESYGYNKVDVEQIAYVSIKGKGSSSLTLLREFQRKGMELLYFKDILQKIECQGALDCFKKPSELHIDI